MEALEKNTKDIPLTTKMNYESHYVDVLGSKMHYLDEGKGDPILFLHGIPTWSFLWRNIIPALNDLGRCIAPDLIGMGKSDKPNIAYRIFDHIRYIETFIRQLDLKNITFVLHGWGSVVGFDIAMRYPEKVKGIAFIEGYLRPLLNRQELPLPVQEIMNAYHLPKGGKDEVLNNSDFVNKLITAGTVRKLGDEEIAAYLEPFQKTGSRQPIWQFIQDAPIAGGPQDVIHLIENYKNKLEKSPIEKLMLYAIPGFITAIETVKWASEHLPQLTLVDIGDGHHYVPEGNPVALRNALRQWYLEKISH